ncbi:MAG: DivIVA domain-containing protein [Mycetocola sp.]
MTPNFPMSSRGTRGYSVDEVDRFLATARIAFDGADDRVALEAADIRTTAFRLKRRGYSVPHVDAALERLEDAFALREREGEQAKIGFDEWMATARGTAQELLDRLAQPEGERFSRAAFLTQGYLPADVDAFASQVSEYFQGQRSLTVADVRTAGFRSKRGGYRESEVDSVLDEVVAVMLAVR